MKFMPSRETKNVYLLSGDASHDETHTINDILYTNLKHTCHIIFCNVTSYIIAHEDMHDR